MFDFVDLLKTTTKITITASRYQNGSHANVVFILTQQGNVFSGSKHQYQIVLELKACDSLAVFTAV